MVADQAKDTWKAALGELQLQVTKPYYETYLKNTVGLEFEGGRFVVGVPTSFGVEWLYLRMRSRIEETLSGIAKCPINARFVVCQNPNDSAHRVPSKVGDHDSADGPREVSAYAPDTARNDTVEFEDYSSLLNRRFTFSSFVVGGFNRMAHAAAMAVAESPGQDYNPLFIYGTVGIGKTHLLHAIGHAAHSSHKHILYISAEQFTNDLVSAIRTKDSQPFREKYREVDLLLVDDIQFISGKQQTQEGFYHTFNSLHNANKQIVIAGDCHPGEIPVLEDRLVSRFEGGLLADIHTPDLETRIAILEAKAAQQKLVVPREILDLIARRVQGSVRKLEGALNRVIACARAAEVPITLAIASDALDRTCPDAVRFVSPETVIGCTAAYFNLSPDDLRGKSRLKKLVAARDVTMYLLREELRLPPMRIGGLLGDRTPTAVSMSHRKIASKLPKADTLRNHIALIRDSIYSHTHSS